jgi:hypothetical protein
MAKKILFFSPYQGIPEHSFIEKKLAEILQDRADYQTDVITCDGFLQKFCVAMAAHKVNFVSPEADKKKICVKCKQYKNHLYKSNFNGKCLTVDENLTPEIESILTKETPEIVSKLQNYIFDEVPLGLISSYLLILNHKLANLDNLPQYIQDEFIHSITSNLRVYLVMRNLLNKSRYDAVIFYNGNYDINNTVVSLIRKSFPKTKPIFIHYGHNWARSRDKLFLIKNKHNEHLRGRIHYFEENVNSLDLSQYDMSEVDAYKEALHSASTGFIYSEAKSNNAHAIFDTLKLDPKKPTVLMSLSSTDEKFATEFAVTQSDKYPWIELTFKDQMEWVEKTVEFFAKNPQWQLVIRIHPREYPNRRDNVLSKAAAFYQKISERIPPNAVINSPENKLSIYDFFDVVHLHLTSWSTVGLESSLSGVPTISTTRGFGLYPNKYVHFFSPEQSDYFSEIRRVLSQPKTVDLKTIKRAKTWVLYDFNVPIITFDTQDFWEKKPSIWRRALNKYVVPTRLRSYQDYSKNFSISQGESKVVVDFFEKNKDIFELKSEHKHE